ncbi:MAG: hypothetical protein RSA65_10400, partial [Clostridia bacterium]
DACFSDLKGDPWLAQRIINGADKKEIKVKKKRSLGVVLALVLILATVAVAIAAQQLGWVDLFGTNYNIAVPTAAQEAMEGAQPQTFQVGPMTITYKQLLTDKHIVMSAAEARMTDGSEVLYADDSNFYEAVDGISDTVLKKYNLKHGTTWIDAAKQLQLPLYGIRALVSIAPEYTAGESMEDSLWNEDGSILYFNMPMVSPKTIQDKLPVTLYMAVHQYNPATDAIEINKWVLREDQLLPVLPLLAEKTYQPDGDAKVQGMKLLNIHAEQYATGVYLMASFTAPDGMTAEEARAALFSLAFCDDTGNGLPYGMNLSSAAYTDGLPSVEWVVMSSMEELPDGLIISDSEAEVSAK